MANKRLELSGQTINQITVISPAGSSPKGAVLWLCRCNRCGKEFVIDGARLRGKNPRKDCGCSWRERSADLSGQAFGGMDVLRRNGTGNNGDALYLCKCRLCGQEKTLPACTIRSKPKSCGCQAVSREKLAQASRLGVDTKIVDGCNIYAATRTEPDANNTTGRRWVVVQTIKGRRYIKAQFNVRGKRYYKGGFADVDSAHAWAEEAHAKALIAENIPTPIKNKRKRRMRNGPESI